MTRRITKPRIAVRPQPPTRRRVFRPQMVTTALPARRRRSLRYDLDANVQLLLSDHLSIFARATDISRTGIRIQVHGNTLPGQRFRVVFRPGADTEEGANAEVRWVGRSNLDGVRPVGMQWIDATGEARPRIEAMVERAQAAQ